ncbi:Leucine-rich repeat, cysteine-containing subtype [Parasponia andersonii]|uniref:Leucine-rich repeat, cysteine-containing subtype n=1 Tax=Parasponia andersonii TaxID=3476 RepID=A0A2P5DPF1_PARAD|nr:Leucine-rich repeat, cysteine-containing subtype [Parasponia andersonii]
MEGPSGDRPTSIMHLPDDCLFFIFHWLDCFSDRESFGLTCRRWLQIQNLSRRSLQFACSFTHLSLSSLSHPNFNFNSFHLLRLLSRFRNLQTLSLAGCIYLTDSGLTTLQYCGSNLQSIYFDCCFSITDDGFSLAAAACPSLAVVSLCQCKITDVGLANLAKACSGLKQVNLSYCRYISDHGLRALSHGCRQLQAVRISFCSSVTGVGFRGGSSTLAYVEAESCNPEPQGIEGIVSGGGIEYLDVSCRSWHVCGDGLAALGTGLGSSLKILNLRLCRTVGDESISAIAKGCPLLQEWNLALCHEVRISGWISIGMNCNNLEKLHVNGCRNLCNNGLLALRNGCRRLSILYMSRCAKITSAALELFKCYRGNVYIIEAENMCIGPKLFR